MKAWVRDSYGPPDVLRLEESQTPTPKDGEVLVRVHAASLNAADLDYLYGRPLIARLGTGMRRPRNRRLGLDVAGVVEAVGPEAIRFQPGDEVFGDLTEAGYGAFADHVVAREQVLAPKPASMAFEESATVPQSAILALQGLRSWRSVEPGEHVLVNGASGNVGPFAVQIAKAMGAEVTGVSSTDKLDFVRSIGADHVIDYSREDFAAGGRRYDRIIDVKASRSFFTIRRVLKARGVYAWIGGTSATLLQAITVGPLMSVTGSRKLGIFMWKPGKPEDMAYLTELIEAGHIRPVIDRRYPLDEVPDALRYLDAGRAKGKVVISV